MYTGPTDGSYCDPGHNVLPGGEGVVFRVSNHSDSVAIRLRSTCSVLASTSFSLRSFIDISIFYFQFLYILFSVTQHNTQRLVLDARHARSSVRPDR
jgi:hypothetical protein